MNGNDFAALVGLVTGALVQVWGVLDSIEIVDDGTYRLTAMTAGTSIIFLFIVVKIINYVRNGGK